MSRKSEILKFASALNAIKHEQLHFHKNRILLLLKRVKIVVDLVDKNIDESRNDLAVSQSLMLLSITLEEILEYVVLFSTSGESLATHIVQNGSDEEQFIKWNERLQHISAEQKLEIDMFDVFDESSDFHAFQKDIAILRDKNELLKIIVLIHGSNSDTTARILLSIEGLLNHQTSVRTTYQTKTAPGAALELNPKKIKYEKVIGRGGNFNFTK